MNMRTGFSMAATTRGLILPGFVLLLAGLSINKARAQDGLQPSDSSGSAWQRYDWLTPQEEQQRQAAPGETYHATVTQDINDPFAVLSSGTLWQQKTGAVDTRKLGDGLTLSCQTSTIDMDDYSDDLSRSQLVALQFDPVPEMTLRCDLHDSASDAPIAADSSTTSGATLYAEGHLPTNTVLSLGAQYNRTVTDAPTGLDTQTNIYDAQLKQPISGLPLTAVLKGHFEATSTGGAAPTSLPSLEQSLEWKPAQNTTIQAGLRQQQYQEYPGVDHELNEALFADWQQKIVDDVSWHSYAEVLNSKGLIDTAPAAAISSGANGTAQQNNPANNGSLTSSLPISIDQQTLTLSTGPSFKLQKDISASVEYSDRWDSSPAAGSSGQEQRVSVSLKGTF
jgi:hypothetical protein